MPVEVLAVAVPLAGCEVIDRVDAAGVPPLARVRTLKLLAYPPGE